MVNLDTSSVAPCKFRGLLLPHFATILSFEHAFKELCRHTYDSTPHDTAVEGSCDAFGLIRANSFPSASLHFTMTLQMLAHE
jgi:hypothetical protein